MTTKSDDDDACEHWRLCDYCVRPGVLADRDRLLADVARLTRERDEARAEVSALEAVAEERRARAKRAEAEVERLRAGCEPSGSAG